MASGRYPPDAVLFGEYGRGIADWSTVYHLLQLEKCLMSMRSYVRAFGMLGLVVALNGCATKAGRSHMLRSWSSLSEAAYMAHGISRTRLIDSSNQSSQPTTLFGEISFSNSRDIKSFVRILKNPKDTIISHSVLPTNYGRVPGWFDLGYIKKASLKWSLPSKHTIIHMWIIESKNEVFFTISPR